MPGVRGALCIGCLETSDDVVDAFELVQVDLADLAERYVARQLLRSQILDEIVRP